MTDRDNRDFESIVDRITGESAEEDATAVASLDQKEIQKQYWQALVRAFPLATIGLLIQSAVMGVGVMLGMDIMVEEGWVPGPGIGFINAAALSLVAIVILFQLRRATR